MKHLINAYYKSINTPAAFRRLCVETYAVRFIRLLRIPAAFRRLCVETVLGTANDALGTASRL